MHSVNQHLLRNWPRSCSYNLSWKITEGIHSCKPALLNCPIYYYHHFLVVFKLTSSCSLPFFWKQNVDCNKNTHVLLTYMPVCFSQTIPPPPPTLCLRTQQWQGPEVWLLGSHWRVLVTARWPASVTGTAASWPVWRNHPSATVCLSPSSKKSTLHPKVSEAVVMGVDLCKVCFISYQGVWHYSQKWVRL